MPILRPFLLPTVATPQQVVAQGRQRKNSRTIAQSDFYQQQLQQPTSPQQQAVAQPNSTEGGTTTDVAQFVRPPETGDQLRNQIKRYAERSAPPQLEPQARVRSSAAELVEPSSFKKYYEQLNQITGIGQEQLAAEQARNMFRRAQAASSISAISNTSRPNQPNVGQSFGGGVPANPQANFKYAQAAAPKYGWSGDELSAWYTLGMKESGWRNTAQNPTSTAYGIGQFLNSTWSSVGGTKTSDPAAQVDYMAKYIKQRYGSPSRALAFHLKNNWY